MSVATVQLCKCYCIKTSPNNQIGDSQIRVHWFCLPVDGALEWFVLSRGYDAAREKAEGQLGLVK
eukprot:613591-Amphidinium_carterae.1